MNGFRIGQGIDVHPYAEDRPLVLGGVTIPGGPGLAGHSDADVLLHAITDAVLGALAWGDLGSWFPDTDEQYRNADSAGLLAAVWSKASAEGWTLGNVDAMVLAEVPRLAPHIGQMRSRIAELMGAIPEQVSVKATTTEKLGFVGRKEGMVASAVVLLTRIDHANLATLIPKDT